MGILRETNPTTWLAHPRKGFRDPAENGKRKGAISAGFCGVDPVNSRLNYPQLFCLLQILVSLILPSYRVLSWMCENQDMTKSPDTMLAPRVSYSSRVRQSNRVCLCRFFSPSGNRADIVGLYLGPGYGKPGCSTPAKGLSHNLSHQDYYSIRIDYWLCYLDALVRFLRPLTDPQLVIMSYAEEMRREN